MATSPAGVWNRVGGARLGAVRGFFDRLRSRPGDDDHPRTELPVGAVVLAPLDGQGRFGVGPDGSVSTELTSSVLEFAVRTSEGWMSPTPETTVQALLGAAATLSEWPIPGGAIEQRCAAGVVGGAPAAIIEVHNNSANAVAVGIRCGAHRAEINGQRVTVDGLWIGSSLEPRPALDADDPAIVIPLPHTATLTLVVPLVGDADTRRGLLDAAVPATDDIARGWDRHLESGFRIGTGDDDLDDVVAPLQRQMMTLGPDERAPWRWLVAMAETGQATEASVHLGILADAAPEHCLYAVGRCMELGGDEAAVEDLLEPFAKAAWELNRRSGPVLAPMGWSTGALAAAVRAAYAIDQPDVADEVAKLTEIDVRISPVPTLVDVRAQLAEADAVLRWPDEVRAHGGQASSVLRSLRHLMVEEFHDDVGLVPAMPVAWRGRSIEAHNLPVAAGRLSFGLRWHGPRPALLWDLTRTSDARFGLRVPSISDEWTAIDEQGEDLLPDPGWSTS